MKTQDRFPYNSTLVGLNNICQTIGSNSFYINSECILSTDKIITKGKEYIIFDRPTETGIKILDVMLVDCYYSEGLIYLNVQDKRSHRVFSINHCLECQESHCIWMLVDLDYFIDMMDAK